MSSCCDPVTDAKPQRGAITVALAGNPNSGKTTIFNGLTGLRQKVANYPGVTVERKTGRCQLPDGTWADVIDVPGTYSLISRSPDELVAMEVLRGLRTDTKTPDLVIVVVDASNLQRNLYLVSQLIELGRPMVVALNMMDVAERRGLKVSPEVLQRELGVPVVPVVGHKRQGMDQLKAAIANAAVARMPDWPLPEPMKEELLLVGGGLAILDSEANAAARVAPPDARPQSSWRSRRDKPTKPQLGDAVPPRAWICGDTNDRRLDRYEALAERLLIGDRAGELNDIARQEPVASLLTSATDRLQQLGIEPMQADIEAHYRWIDGLAHRVVTVDRQPEASSIDAAQTEQAPPEARRVEPGRTLTQRVDAILIHKIWGLLIFALIMATLFVTIFWAAAPIMTGISASIDALGALLTSRLSGPLKDLLKDGIFAGVGAVIVFVPQIALLFLFLAVLEDSGYLARAAFLMDRVLAKVGLHGKSFIPLLSSFACAIPGIMATRTIENRKDRLATILVAPFMSCSARLPVYTLLIGTFFAAWGAAAQAGIMLALYALGIVAAAATAWIFKRSLLRGPAPAFILEMPSYKLPQLSQVARQVWTNTRAFITKAGTTIFCLSIILWAMAYYPRLPEHRVQQIRATAMDGKASEKEAIASADNAVSAAQSEYSIAGRMGHAMEPVIKPLGYDWKMGVGLVGAFAAREVFVSTMGIIYSVGQVEDETGGLSSAMRQDRYANGRPVWTPLVAVSLLVWFVLAMQCMSTVAIVRRETGGWRWPIFMIVYMNGLAYVVSLIVYQVGSLLLRV